MTLGYIGLGYMGAPMATRLLEWPGGLVVCDKRADVVAPFVDGGASAAATPADVAAAADIISATVLDDAQVRDVVTGTDGLLSTATAGTIIAIHSTISDTTAVELAAICRDRGVEVVDAPVSGGAGGAQQGKLAVMIGGLDIRALGKVVRHTDAITGGAGAIMLRDTTAPVAEADFWHPILSHVRNLGE